MRAPPNARSVPASEGMATDVLSLLMGVLGVPSVTDLAGCTRQWSRAGPPQMAARYARRTYELAARMHPQWWRQFQDETDSQGASGGGRGVRNER